MNGAVIGIEDAFSADEIATHGDHARNAFATALRRFPAGADGESEDDRELRRRAISNYAHALLGGAAYQNGPDTDATADAPPPLRWRTAKEIAASTPAEVPWIVKPQLAAGALTEVDGKIKGGKTTYVLSIVRSVLDGTPFLGEQATKAKVVWLTEQPDTSFRAALKKADLLEREDLIVLSYADVRDVPWRAIVEAAVAKALEIGATVLVVDTFGQWAGLAGDAENNAGDSLAAIAPLQVAAATHGLAVLIVRHERKGGGEVGDSARGSTAIGGAVDVIIALRELSGEAADKHPTRRVLHARSRFDETPGTLLIELTEAGYGIVDPEVDKREQAGAKAAAQRRTLLEALPTDHAEARTVQDLMKKTKLARSTVQTILTAFVEEGEAVRYEAVGEAGKPFRYFRTDPTCRDDLSERATTSPDRSTGGGNGHGVSPDGGGGLSEPTTHLSGDMSPVGGDRLTGRQAEDRPPPNGLDVTLDVTGSNGGAVSHRDSCDDFVCGGCA